MSFSNNYLYRTSNNSNNCRSTCRANRPPKRVARGSCTDDYAAVAALPDNWKPRHSGPILANYLKQREQDHKTVLDDIANSAAPVNEDINKRVRALSENLLIRVKHNQRRIDCLLDKYEEGDTPLAAASRDTVLEMVQNIMAERIRDTKDYKQSALRLERERADKLRILLRGQFQRLVAIGHKTPKDLMHDFDERIYDINQQLISNSKAYIELEADLRRVSDEGITIARSALNQLCLGIEFAVRGRSSLIWSKDQKVSRHRAQNIPLRVSAEPRVNIIQQVKELDAIMSLLVEAYRNAVLKIFSGFSIKLTELENDLGHNELRGPNEIQNIELSDLDQVLERQLQNLTDSLNKKSDKTFFEMTGADIITMQESVWSLGECLRETCSILNHAGHLWDAHILRSALAQKLTITAVEDLLTNHDSIELANEVSFNIALEQIRCSPETDKLEQQFDAVLVLLDKTATMYLEHSELELGRLEEFMNVPAVMATTLLAEFNVFLEKYPRAPLKALRSTTSLTGSISPRRSQSASAISLVQQALPRAILQTGLQEIALKNWRNGFLESFKSNVSVLPEELNNQALRWIEERSAALHMRYSLKIVSHNIRLERVKAAREKRLAELRYHDLRLESHLGAINKLIENLPEEVSQFAALDAPILYPFCEIIDRMEVNINNSVTQDPEVKKTKMKSYAVRLVKHRQLFEESLETVIVDYKKLLENRIHEARISNVRYISHVKLFSEGGNFNAVEALKTCTALGKAADSLELCLNKSLDVLNQRRSNLLSLADQKIAPLQRLADESCKVQGKASGRSAHKIIDKKKKI